MWFVMSTSNYVVGALAVCELIILVCGRKRWMEIFMEGLTVRGPRQMGRRY